MAIAAPVIVAEMNDWVALGGTNSGIVGDPSHNYGFHRAANEVPASDYSRARDPAGPNAPANWDWACAGDFGHGGNAALRARHLAILERLMAGELQMICEFIGQPWADQPVKYWSRWENVLKDYDGEGHDTWTHLAWYRSRADQRAYLYTEAPPPPPPPPPPVQVLEDTQRMVARNLDGRLELFVLGAGGALRHRWQEVPNGGWSGWASLGGESAALSADLGLARNADGRLEVFARSAADDGSLQHLWQTAPNNGWSGWAGLGGSGLEAPVVLANLDGRLEAFALDGDGGLVHLWQTAPNNGWSGWDDLGGTDLSSIAVGRNADGRLEVFALDGGGGLVHLWQTAPNNGWSGWDDLGGTDLSSPAVGRNADGRLEVFALDGDGGLVHLWQTAPNNGWSGWDDLGGTDLSSIAVARNEDKRLEVFAIGNGSLQHLWQTAPNNGWSGWDDLGGSELALSPDVIQNADGRLEVFVTRATGEIQHIWQTSPNGGWSGWQDFGVPG
jgi:hypothetical protein